MGTGVPRAHIDNPLRKGVAKGGEIFGYPVGFLVSKIERAVLYRRSKRGSMRFCLRCHYCYVYIADYTTLLSNKTLISQDLTADLAKSDVFKRHCLIRSK